jgi:hypothetical protein
VLSAWGDITISEIGLQAQKSQEVNFYFCGRGSWRASAQSVGDYALDNISTTAHRDI